MRYWDETCANLKLSLKWLDFSLSLNSEDMKKENSKLHTTIYRQQNKQIKHTLGFNMLFFSRDFSCETINCRSSRKKSPQKVQNSCREAKQVKD